MLLRMYEELSVTTWNYTYPNLDITCNKLSYEVDMTGPLHERATLWFNSCKRPPPISNHLVYAFWVVAYGRFDCITYYIHILYFCQPEWKKC